MTRYVTRKRGRYLIMGWLAVFKHYNASRITSCATLQAYDRMGHEAYENMEAAGGSPGGQDGPFAGSGPFSGSGAQVCGMH